MNRKKRGREREKTESASSRDKEKWGNRNVNSISHTLNLRYLEDKHVELPK